MNLIHFQNILILKVSQMRLDQLVDLRESFTLLSLVILIEINILICRNLKYLIFN